MKNHSSKLKHQEEQHAEQQHQATHRQATVEFNTPEELLRHDASQVAPPPSVAERLGQSVAREPKPSRSWWQRVFRLKP
jgi:hypothetical protein